MDVEHSDFDEVGGGALNDGVDSEAVCLGAFVCVSALEVLDFSSAVHNGFDIAGFFCVLDDLVRKVFDGAVSFKIIVDEFFCFGDRDADGF